MSEIKKTLATIFCEKRTSYSKKYARMRLKQLIYSCTGEDPETESVITLLKMWHPYSNFNLQDTALLDHFGYRDGAAHHLNVRDSVLSELKFKQVFPLDFPISRIHIGMQFLVKSILFTYDGKSLFQINAIRCIKGRTYLNFTLRQVHDLAIFRHIQLRTGTIALISNGVCFKKIRMRDMQFILRFMLRHEIKFHNGSDY